MESYLPAPDLQLVHGDPSEKVAALLKDDLPLLCALLWVLFAATTAAQVERLSPVDVLGEEAVPLGPGLLLWRGHRCGREEGGGQRADGAYEPARKGERDRGGDDGGGEGEGERLRETLGERINAGASRRSGPSMDGH